MKTSFSVTVIKSFCPSPAFLHVNLASLKCLPEAQFLASTGDALSYTCVKTKLPGVAFPRPEPPPEAAPDTCDTSQDQEMTSISSL